MQPRSEPNGRVESAGGTSDGRAGLVYVVSNDPGRVEGWRGGP